MSEQPEFLAENVGRQLTEGGGMWAPCSGCHESVDGYSVTPIDPVFRCYRGSGCSECGGIGAIWDTTDYEELYDAMVKDMHRAPAQLEAPAPVVGVPELTTAAAAIIDVMSGDDTSWRGRLHDSDFLESADWQQAVRYAEAALLSQRQSTGGASYLPQYGGDAARPYYSKAATALQAAHDACFKASDRDALGMSAGPFSGVNIALGIVASLESDNARLRSELEANHHALVATDGGSAA